MIYIERLWAAIKWKPYKEPSRLWSLDASILEDIIDYVDYKNRRWYAYWYTEEEWEELLQEFKKHAKIVLYSYEVNKKSIEYIENNIGKIFFNLWD